MVVDFHESSGSEFLQRREGVFLRPVQSPTQIIDHVAREDPILLLTGED
jgi:hypothetical protein